jgi:hypothetical protein
VGLQVRDIVLGHAVPQKLTFDDLMAMPDDELTPTLLPGNTLKLSASGTTPSSNVGEGSSGSIALLQKDIDACTPNSTMHTIRALLPIANIALPPTAAPRTCNVSSFIASSLVVPVPFLIMICTHCEKTSLDESQSGVADSV